MKKSDLSSISNLGAALHLRAAEEANKIILTALKTNLDVISSLTFQELNHKASLFAQALIQTTEPKSRVLLLFNNDLSFIEAFWACLLAGMIAVPLYPPQADKQFERIRNIISDCDPQLILCGSNSLELIDQVLANQHPLTQRKVVSFEELANTNLMNSSTSSKLPEVQPDDIAFLQYTSGSTGQPKGVMITHENILENANMLIQGYNYDTEDIALCWMPFYHDLGLMGGVLIPILAGTHTYIVEPKILARPLKLLQAYSKYKISISATPNFVLERILQNVMAGTLADLNLASLRLLICGAEPINASTLEQFNRLLYTVGLSATAIAPSYGLAEATVLVTTRAQEPVLIASLAENGKSRKIVSCGRSVGNEVVAILSSPSHGLAKAFEVGEILVNGKNVCSGYWNRKNEDGHLFTNINGLKFLRTGDLGFLNDKGELFVIGRSKDLLIVRGRKFHAVDLETEVTNFCADNKLFSSEPLSICAFQNDNIEADQDIYILIGITNSSMQSTNSKTLELLNEHLCEVFGVANIKAIPIQQNVIKKTSSGKIRRQDSKRAYFEMFA